MAVTLIEVIGQIERVLFCVDIRCPISLESKNTNLTLKFLVCPEFLGDEFSDFLIVSYFLGVPNF